MTDIKRPTKPAAKKAAAKKDDTPQVLAITGITATPDTPKDD